MLISLKVYPYTLNIGFIPRLGMLFFRTAPLEKMYNLQLPISCIGKQCDKYIISELINCYQLEKHFRSSVFNSRGRKHITTVIQVTEEKATGFIHMLRN